MKKQVLWLGEGKAGQSSEVSVTATTGLRVLLYAGEPVGEPVVIYGPFVMNTREEIVQAYEDYRNGEFV